ncbi:MAG: polyprenyl synthetase family protein [Thermoplasmata archaeon]
MSSPRGRMIDDFEAYLTQTVPIVERELAEFIETEREVPNLHDALRYSLGLDVEDRRFRGKRIRPVLALLACESLGGTVEQAMPFAVATELLHNFLLTHDDIQDGDEMRHDRATVWKKYGFGHGINVGDYLFAKMYESALGTLKFGIDEKAVIRLVELLTQTVNHTGEGQAMDISARQRKDLTADEYLETVIEKTGYYLACPIQGGALIGGASEDVLRNLESYGKHIGPVFQIRDDIIDMTMGKGRGERGSDIKEGKRSLLVVIAAGNCTDEEREELFAVLDRPRAETSDEDVQRVFEIFRRHRAAERAEEIAQDFLGKCNRALEKLPSPLMENIQVASDFMLSRKK